MRAQTFVPLLLAASASALPGQLENAKRQETPSATPTPSTTPEPEPTTTSQPEPEPTLPPEEICALPFNDGDSGVIADTWENSGAASFLSDFLTENGVESWVDGIFQETVGNGEQGGSTYDCTNFPAEGKCTSPGHKLCTEYDPVGMFFIHLSISNLYSSFVRIHEGMQDDMIINLASEIKKIVEVFGPPPPDDPSILTFLIGAFVLGAAMAGPAWTIGAPLTAVVGGLNIAAGAAAQDDQAEPIDFEHDLELSLGSFYSRYADILEDTVIAIFGGDFSGFENFDSDPVEWVSDQFAEGKMLDHTIVDPQIDEYLDATTELIKQGLVIQAMKKEEHYIWQDYTKQTEEECAERNHAMWIGDWCTTLVKDAGGSMTGYHPYPVDDELYDSMTGDYGFDYQELLQNAVDCAAAGGGDPDLISIPSFDDPPTGLPPCFANFDVSLQDFYGIPYDPEDYE
ncbi:hypothetical protein FQN54_009723 [Arachnomyces sp. PD_36]|nr:hypothetical protein FQN54_009723 [Arachnomyces sp. PD_36]